ncbi:MAG: hypothetical protein IJV69_02615 [Kiritimatiellae bacterium]|nr:hypothetical protein [Kiritimatiellia bacterium]
MIKQYFLFLSFLFAIGWGHASPEQNILEMTGQAEGARPDILYLAPRLLLPPKAYTKTLASTAKYGTVLPHAFLTESAFCSMGPLPVLSTAGYRILPIRDVSWVEATQRLTEIFALRQKTRYEDGIQQAPLCVILSEEVKPDELADTLPKLLALDALIFLAPQEETLPLTVIWKNYVWPTQRSEQSLRVEHWVATLAEIAGLYPPASSGAVSILPMLTGSGYQRPLEQPLLLGPTAAASQKVAPCTMICSYTQLPEEIPWVPDFTDQSKLKPTERLFVSSTVPIDPEAVSGLSARRSPQGLYIRTALATLDLKLPPQVSCVVRVKGHSLFSVWQPETETSWQLACPDLQIVEFFLILPPKMDPVEALPFLFVSKPEAEADATPPEEKVKTP